VAEATVGDQSRGTDRPSPRRRERCRLSLPATRRAGGSLRRVGLYRERSTCSDGPSRSAGPTGPRRPAEPFPVRCLGEDSGRPTRAPRAAGTGQASSRPSPTSGSSSCTVPSVEDRTCAEAARNCRRSSSRETDSSSSLSERRITSVLDRALSSRLNRRTCACSLAARVNDDFPMVLDFMLISYLQRIFSANVDRPTEPISPAQHGQPSG
jgi:hypothetical protein